MGRYPLKSRMNEYMTAMEPYYAPTTLKQRLSCLNTINAAYVSLRENDKTLEADPERWGEQEVMAIVADMRAKGLSNGTQAHRLSVLKKLLEFVGNGVLGKIRAQQPHAFPKVYTERKASLSLEELGTVLAAAKEIPDWTGECALFCLSMYAYTGDRRGELLLAHREDLNTKDWTFWVRHPKGERTYGKKRLVPIPDRLRATCIRYLQAREIELRKRGVQETTPLVFSIKDHRKFLNPGVMNCWTDQISDKTGIKFSPQALRRTYGQILLDKHAIIDTVSLMLGHKSTQTTEKHYCRKNEDDARLEVLKALRSEASSPPRHNCTEKHNSPELNSKDVMTGYA